MSSANRQALVIGATGFLGMNLVQSLLDGGWRVTAVQRGIADSVFLGRLGVDQRTADVRDPAQIAAVIPHRCDAVFHVAADMTFWPKHHDRQYQVNVVGTRNVVDTCLRHDVERYVFVSSAAAYGLHPERLTEETPRIGHKSRIGYVRTKALAEDEVRDGARRGLNAVIFNPTTIIGRYDTRVWLPVFQQVARGRLPGVAPGHTSFCHAAEVARVIALSADLAETSDSYLLGGPDATFVDVVQQIASLIDGQAPRRATPAPLVRAFGRLSLLASHVTRREPKLTPEGVEYLIDRNVVSSARAIAELDYRPPAIETALQDYWGWLRAEGLL